ncbi:integrase catalytic domain-containing protein [Trichonephila clavipes]|nr:integrase catalytic domain-containing protein [Trichonephila clavipes]
MSNCLGIKNEKIKTPVSSLNGLSQNIKWKLKTIISNEDSSFAEPVDFLIVDKTEFTPSSSLDISNVEIPNSSPFLLAATIRHHIEKYKHEFPDTVELLDRNFYVDDLISGGKFEEALQTSRRAKNIMEAAGMDLRKWITNDVNLMEQWKKKKNFNVHPVHETVSLGANGTKVLGLSWNTNEDYLTTDTKSLLEFVSLD